MSFRAFGLLALLLGVLSALVVARGAIGAPPGNDLCANATAVNVGASISGTAEQATPDGNSSCAAVATGDVYHRVTTLSSGVYTISMCAGTSWDTVLSLHTGCPADLASEIACDDDGCRPSGATDFGYPSTIRVFLPASTTYIIRVAGYDAGSLLGTYSVSVAGPPARTGACCIVSACLIQSQANCAGAGGTYWGDQSACILPRAMSTTYADNGAPMAIPGNNLTGVSRTINVPDTFNVGDVRVNVTLSHRYVGDLTIRLKHGTTVATLIDHVGLGVFGSDAMLNGTYSFLDTAQSTLWDAAPTSSGGALVPAGSYLASASNSGAVSLKQVFNGQAASGVWTLQVVDASPGFDDGVITSWSITLDRAGPDPCSAAAIGACCSGSLSTSCGALNPLACANAGGSFAGFGTVCATAAGNPTGCCKANFNGVNGVGVQDLLDYVTAWLAGLPSANINATPGVTVQDLLDFFTLWLAGCP